MKTTIVGLFCGVLVFTLLSWLGTAREPAKGAAAAPWTYLDQGWSEDQRQQFYTTPQGSYLLPYEWFLHLEQPGADRPFRSEDYMERFRYLPNRNPKTNPDGLPVGFVKESPPLGLDGKRNETVLMRPFMGPNAKDSDFPRPQAWLGLTCAACHTTQLTYKGTTLRIDGGPTLADLNEFIASLNVALQLTFTEADRFDRFAARLLGPKAAAADKESLRAQLETQLLAMRAYADRNRPPFAHGFGRLDAFGLIMNELFGTALKIPANYRAVDAPVSYPDLWYTPETSWVQWNGSATSPFLRNVGEVTGAFGHVQVTGLGQKGFPSTVRGKNLYDLEQLVAKLKSPPWDEKTLGKLDPGRVKRGEALYTEAGCADCHGKKPYPRTPPNAFKKTFLAVKMIPLDTIGTDRKMALNFATRTVLPGPIGHPNDPPLGGFLALASIVVPVANQQYAELKLPEDAILEYNDFRTTAPPPNLIAYRARPLTGVWATAPYLHNGSVPTLLDLLKHPTDRPITFYVGSREYDPKNVGFRTDKTPGAFLFDARLPGNSNAGHDYGTTLTPGQKWDLIEYLKTL
jgi:hypothetical protein